ncbi:MAG: hypothetical protein WA635_12265 [Gallionella sp.]
MTSLLPASSLRRLFSRCFMLGNHFFCENKIGVDDARRFGYGDLRLR